jgi:hypothetical protein
LPSQHVEGELALRWVRCHCRERGHCTGRRSAKTFEHVGELLRGRYVEHA